jgi:hypothetical protein
MVNSFPLEEIGANTIPSVTLKNNERDETARMIEHIMLLENRLKDEPKTYDKLLKRLLAYTNANGLHFTGRVQSDVYWYD